MDAVIAWRWQRETIMTEPGSQGAYRRELALSGDEDKASRVRAELMLQETLESIQNGQSQRLF